MSAKNTTDTRGARVSRKKSGNMKFWLLAMTLSLLTPAARAGHVDPNTGTTCGNNQCGFQQASLNQSGMMQTSGYKNSQCHTSMGGQCPDTAKSSSGSNYGGGSSYGGGDGGQHMSPPIEADKDATNKQFTPQHPNCQMNDTFQNHGGKCPKTQGMSGNSEKKEGNKLKSSNNRGGSPLVDTAHVAQPHSSDLSAPDTAHTNSYKPGTFFSPGPSTTGLNQPQTFSEHFSSGSGGNGGINTIKISQPTTINLGEDNVGTGAGRRGPNSFFGGGIGASGGGGQNGGTARRGGTPELGSNGGAFDHISDPRGPHGPRTWLPGDHTPGPHPHDPRPRDPRDPRIDTPPDDPFNPRRPGPGDRPKDGPPQGGGGGGGNMSMPTSAGIDTITFPHTEPHPSAAGSAQFPKTDGVQDFVKATGATGAVAGQLTGGALAAVAAGGAAVMANNLKNTPGSDSGQAKSNQNSQKQSGADNLAAMERFHAATAIEWVRTFLENFTVDGGNKWNQVRDKLFVPMAILLLLPGAVICQVKSIASQGFVVLGEIQPFEGIFRSIIGIFLIPATYLVVNYGIDIANSLTETVATSYRQLFGSDMYSDAFCGHIRAFPIREPEENPGQITKQEAQMFNYFGNTPLARLEGKTLAIKYADPCVGLYIVPPDRNNDNVPYMVNEQRLAYNQANAAFTMAWVILCAVQQAYLYYLWFVGPVIAACWVYPSRQLREAFPSWIEGVVTLCCWSLFWSVAILLMACFHGVDDTGTIMFTALNFLTIGSAKFAFDFTGLVKDAGREAMSMAQKAAAAAAKGGGGGGGGGGGSKGGGGSPGKGSEKGAEGEKKGPSPMATAEAQPTAGRREATPVERAPEQPTRLAAAPDAATSYEGNPVSTGSKIDLDAKERIGVVAPKVDPPPKAGLTGDQGKPIVANYDYDIDHDNSINSDVVRVGEGPGGDPKGGGPLRVADAGPAAVRGVQHQAPPESAAARAAAQQRADAEAADKKAGKQMTAEERAAADKARQAEEAGKVAKPVDGVIVTAALNPVIGGAQGPQVGQGPVPGDNTLGRASVPTGDDTIKPAAVTGDHPPVVRAREGVGDVTPTQIASGPDPNAVQAAVDRARNSIDPNSFMTAMNTGTGSGPALPDASGGIPTFTGSSDSVLSRDSYIAGAEQEVVSIDYDDVTSYETAASQPLQSSYGSYASQSVDAATEQYLSANAGVIEGQAQQAAQQAAMQAQSYQRQQMSPQEEQAYQQAYEQQSKQQEANRQAAQQLNEQRQKELREQTSQRAREAAQGGQRAANTLGVPRSGLPAGSGQPGQMGRGQAAQGGGPRRLLSRASGAVRKDLKGNIIQPPAGSKGAGIMNGAPGMMKPGAGGVSEYSKQQAAADWTSGLSIANLKRRARTIKKQTEAEKAADLDALKKMQEPPQQ